MREAVSTVLAVLLLVIIFLLIFSLFKPTLGLNSKLFKTTNRKNLSAIYIGLILGVFILIGVIAPPIPQSNKQDNKDTSKNSSGIKNELDNKSQISELYKVEKVIDGDTIDVSISGKTERLRLIGIDTPETVDPRKPVQCFGKEASNKAKELLEGKKVRLEKDSSQGDKDKYERLLRYVYLEDGTSYNKQIILLGYAHEYTYNIPYKYQNEYKQAQHQAEKSSAGLWSPSTCSGNTEKSADTTAPKAATPAPTAPQVAPAPQSGNCDPNYEPCVPNVSYDLDCGDISFSVTVVGTDKHRFDKDGDGHGCESN